MFSEYEKWLSEMDNFRSEFEEKLKSALSQSKKEKIIIFIDDMDRCLQENAISILEIMKNYLSVGNTLFVLGMDRRVIVDHISRRYPSDENSYGQEYLEKIIPSSINIPSNDPIKIVEKNLSEFFGGKIDKAEILEVVKYLEEFCRNNRRLIYIIFHKYLTCLTYINLEKLKNELVPQSGTAWDNDAACRIGILRMCILQERIPTFFDRYNWVREYDNAWGSGQRSEAEELIYRISSGKYSGSQGNPMAPHIDNNIAYRMIDHIENDLFSPIE